MKKLAFISLTLVFMGTQFVMSQGSGDIRFGAKAGFNLASMGGDSRYSYDSKPGFHLGGAVEIPVTDKISVQPEALVSLQGSGGFFQDDLNFWYVNIPVMVKYNIWDALNIEAGPQLGVLVSDNLDGNAFGGGTPGASNASNKIDIGFGAGAGYALDDNFYFQLRYNVGVINAIKDIGSKNRVLQLSAIYFFL